MRLVTTAIPGCFEIFPEIREDNRGSFVKTFHEPTFKSMGLETHFSEEYYSISRTRVLRGLHFQVPPHQHTKLVNCMGGHVFNAVVDLRRNSPTYGKHGMFRLDAARSNMLYIPPGLAHGFYVSGESATLMYRVSTAYAPEHDTGIRWNSAGIAWPDPEPIISPRDAAFVTLGEFDSPFD